MAEAELLISAHQFKDLEIDFDELRADVPLEEGAAQGLLQRVSEAKARF